MKNLNALYIFSLLSLLTTRKKMDMAEHKFESNEISQSHPFPSSDALADQIPKLESVSGTDVESEFVTDGSFEHQWRRSTSKKNKRQQESRGRNVVCLEGVVDGSDGDDLHRTKSLTDEDLDDLKGCLDLGFGFSYDEIPELCNTLPALELCYSMSQKFLDDTSSDTASSAGSDSLSAGFANWKISGPGDHPEDVKARLKFWAQAVACTVKLCS